MRVRDLHLNYVLIELEKNDSLEDKLIEYVSVLRLEVSDHLQIVVEVLTKTKRSSVEKIRFVNARVQVRMNKQVGPAPNLA